MQQYSYLRGNKKKALKEVLQTKNVKAFLKLQQLANSTKPDPVPNDALKVNAFSIAAKAGKLLRSAIKPLLEHLHDPGISARLGKVLMQVIKSVPANSAAEGLVNGEHRLLTGFGFNNRSNLYSVIPRHVSVNIDATLGKVELNLPSFNPALQLYNSGPATHYQFIAAVVEVDFANEIAHPALWNSEQLPFTNCEAEPISNTLAITAKTPLPVIVVFGVKFFKEEGTTKYLLSTAVANAVQIIAVHKGAAITDS
jgi:hypothetical protein